MTLKNIKKLAVLSAVVRLGFDLVGAAEELGMGKATIYRLFKRWGLEPPMASRGGSVMRSIYKSRCDAIISALAEVEVYSEPCRTPEEPQALPQPQPPASA